MPSADAALADKRWHIIDAEGQVLGRVATVAARLLQGKHKASYTPFLDMGDHVVVVNADKVKLTGRKEDQKIYRQHSGYEGGLREERAHIVRQRKPEKLVEDAIHGMLPKTTMGQAMYRKHGPAEMAPVGEVEFVNGIAAMSASGNYGPCRVAEAIMGLHRVCKDVRFLGSYPRHDGKSPVLRQGVTDEDFAEARSWLTRLKGST